MDNETAIAPEQLHLTWETRIRILTNPSVWGGIMAAFGIPSVLLGIFLAFISQRPEYALVVPFGAMAILLPIFIFVGLVIDLFGGFKAVFFLTSHGVRFVSGRGAEAASTAAVVVGLLAGKPGAVGAGLLADSEKNLFIPWTKVARIKVSSGRRYILVKREWGFKPIGLYCTKENFPQVMEILRYYAPNLMPR